LDLLFIGIQMIQRRLFINGDGFSIRLRGRKERAPFFPLKPHLSLCCLAFYWLGCAGFIYYFFSFLSFSFFRVLLFSGVFYPQSAHCVRLLCG